MLTADAYSILGVDSTWVFEDAKREYTRCLRRAHPDTGGSADRFHDVQEAWKVIGSPGFFGHSRFVHKSLFQIGPE